MTLMIKGRLDGLNALIDANRKSRFCGAFKKREQDEIVEEAIKSSLPGVKIKAPVVINCTWYEANRKRDPDNIASAKKYILDALVKAGVLENDTHKWVKGFTDRFEFDKEDPRIECEIIEVDE